MVKPKLIWLPLNSAIESYRTERKMTISPAFTSKSPFFCATKSYKSSYSGSTLI